MTKNNKFTLGFLIFLTSGFSGVSIAETAKTTDNSLKLVHPYQVSHRFSGIITGDTPLVSLAVVQKNALKPVLKELTRGRSIAGSAVEPTEQDFPKDFRDFTKAFYAVNSAASLDKLIADYNSKYDTLSPETKLVVTHLSVLKPLRGILYRLRYVFEKESTAVHSSTVTAIRSLTSSMLIYLPTDQWKAGLEYVSIPSKLNAENTQFANIGQVQDYLVRVVTPILQTAIDRIKPLYLASGTTKILFDNKIAYGTGAFDDGMNRFKIIDTGEFAFDLAQLEMSIFHIDFFCSYNQDQLLQAAEDLARLTGINGFLPFSDLGVSSENRVKKVFQKSKYKSYLTLYTQDGYGNKLMKDAGARLSSALSYYQDGWKSVVDREPSALEFTKTKVAQANDSHMQMRFTTMNSLLNGTPVRSKITGNTVQFKLANLFQNPPVDLKALMPIAFESGSRELKVTTETNDQLTYRNYSKGRAIAWNNAAWASFVPSAAGQSPGYMAEALNTLKYTYGGEMALKGASFFVH